MNRYFLTKLATRDLKKIYEFIESRDLDTALDIVTHLQLMCESLAKMPQMGRKRDGYRKGLRSFLVDDYIIFYRLVGSDIQIVRVLHSAQDSKRIFSK